MTIQFANIPGNIRVPFFYGEVRAGNQGYQQNSVLLLIGYKTAAGSAPTDQPVPIFGNEDKLFGIDSPLTEMVRAARQNAPFQTMAGLALAEGGGDAAAAGTWTITGPATATATAAFYVNGKRYTFVIISGDTATQMAAKMVAAYNADARAVGIAANVAGVVTITSKVKGTWGNTIKFDTGLYDDDDPYFAGIAAIVQPTGGAGLPDITNGLANLADIAYDFVAMQPNDAANIGRLETFFSDISGRWGPYSQVYGHGFYAKDDTFTNLATLGAAHNSQHCTLFGQFNYATPAHVACAMKAAICAAHLSTFPEGSSPLQTLPVIGLVGPKLKADRATVAERQTLYFSGVSMDRFDDFTGECQLDRVLTTYQRNPWGSPDTTFLDINTPLQVMYVLRRMKADFTQNYGRVALADTNPFNVSNIVTPKDIRDQAIHTYTKLAKDGVVENADVFAAALEVERDQNDANRVNMIIPLDMVNQLRILAVAAIVYLQKDQFQGA